MSDPDIAIQNRNRNQSKLRVSRARNVTRASGGALLSGNIDSNHTSQLKIIQDHLKEKGRSSTRIDAVRFSIETTYGKINNNEFEKDSE